MDTDRIKKKKPPQGGGEGGRPKIVFLYLRPNWNTVVRHVLNFKYV